MRFSLFALLLSAMTAAAAPRAVRECSGPNCPATPSSSPAVSYYTLPPAPSGGYVLTGSPFVAPLVPAPVPVQVATTTAPDSLVYEGVRYVREDRAGAPVKAKADAPCPCPQPAAIAVTTPAPVFVTPVPAREMPRTIYTREAPPAFLGSCETSGSSKFGVCGASGFRPIRGALSWLFGGCGG